METENYLKEHIRQLEENLLNPEVRSSRTELKKLLADDFFEFGSSGKVLYKGEDIAEDGIRIVRMTLSDFELHPLSESIVLSTYRIFNEDSKQHSLRSSIWKLNEDKWKMVFHQGTKTDLSVWIPFFNKRNRIVEQGKLNKDIEIILLLMWGEYMLKRIYVVRHCEAEAVMEILFRYC